MGVDVRDALGGRGGLVEAVAKGVEEGEIRLPWTWPWGRPLP